MVENSVPDVADTGQLECATTEQEREYLKIPIFSVVVHGRRQGKCQRAR
ncbi:hypothetical protein AALD74_12980 [Lachnospiraceae bacterium 48-21]